MLKMLVFLLVFQPRGQNNIFKDFYDASVHPTDEDYKVTFKK
jgi:hypothetical protein